MWPQGHNHREKCMPGRHGYRPLDNGGVAAYITPSRGLFPLPAGLDAAARSSDRAEQDLSSSRESLRLALTPDGGFASIGGSGPRFLAAAFERLFDIVIRRKGNAGGGVLASRLLRSRRRDFDVRLRFQANRRVARRSSRIGVAPRLLGTRQNAATPWKIPPRTVRIGF